MDAVLQGAGSAPCPVEICYDTSTGGVPIPFRGERDLCCLAEQTSFLAAFQVETQSIQTVEEATLECAAAPPRRNACNC